MWTVFGLAGYHTSLSCREFSTHEDIRHFPRTLRQAGHENPFGRKNKCLNLSYVLCGPQPPSLLQAWRKVPEDSWPVGARGSVTDPSSMNETVIRMGGTDNAYAVPVPLPIIGPDQNDQNWRDVPGGYPRQQHPQSNVVVESI
ncbi:unnamed protein product [Calicophoron daubneyi]|uniref:Uncharacterized protein n=1 Tax=Calicophoron daubneyi TaxID=300641 RepID=A0AAV2T377_CALDB